MIQASIGVSISYTSQAGRSIYAIVRWGSSKIVTGDTIEKQSSGELVDSRGLILVEQLKKLNGAVQIQYSTGTQ